MRKITVITTHSYQKQVIDALHDQKVIDIIKHKRDENADIGSPLEEGKRISELLVMLRSLMTSLGVARVHHYHKRPELDFDAIEQKIQGLMEEVNGIVDSRRGIEDQVREKKSLLEDLSKAAALEIPLEAFTDFSSVSRFIGNIRNPSLAAEKISQITDAYEIFLDEKGMLAAVFVAKEHEKKTREILEEAGFSEISLNLGNLEGSPDKQIRSVQKEITQLEKTLEGLIKDLARIRKDHEQYLHSIELGLTMEAEKAEAPLVFASSERAFMVTGWAQKDRADAIKKQLTGITEGNVFVKVEKPGKNEDVPVKLKNKLSKPFEALMDLYALPMYKEMDPTFLMFLTFPLLFGFMLGDWGYGLTTLALFTILKRIIPAGRQLFNILILSSLSTIFFGILFGEFFGAEVVAGYDMWRVMSRHHQIDLLLYLALGIGVLHINWGVLNGFINEYNNHGLKAAILEKGSWFVLQGVAMMIALSAFQVWRLKLWVSIALLAIPIYMIYKGDGVQGLVEIPGIFSNILSYARLMAIGLASIKLAEVVNHFAGTFFSQGGIGIAYAVALLAVGHTINIALGIIGPFLHSLRLHYVEYFGKFFKGGARKFKPFGSRG